MVFNFPRHLSSIFDKPHFCKPADYTLHAPSVRSGHLLQKHSARKFFPQEFLFFLLPTFSAGRIVFNKKPHFGKTRYYPRPAAFVGGSHLFHGEPLLCFFLKLHFLKSRPFAAFVRRCVGIRQRLFPLFGVLEHFCRNRQRFLHSFVRKRASVFLFAGERVDTFRQTFDHFSHFCGCLQVVHSLLQIRNYLYYNPNYPILQPILKKSFPAVFSFKGNRTV